MMKVSRQKRLLYSVIEYLGMILFLGNVAVLLFFNMIGAETGGRVAIVLMVLGGGIWMAGGNLRLNLYICPVCKRKLLLKENGFTNRRTIRRELPQECPCGWHVEVEYE